MLSQLKRLNIETDGRYATEADLAFLKSYLQSVRDRISAYEKIRDAEDAITDQADEVLMAADPKVFHKGSQDYSETCRRDRRNTLRHAAAAMLFNDLDRLRDGLLLWQRTIVHAVKDEQASALTWQEMPGVLKDHLSDEEAELMMPALRLNQALLN
ncbi:globin family protein [Acaryochloris marina]|uniref:Allophycocyanin alpha subunit ApcA n=1 Tax=Acaryochloris marina (strain MBIC 11017) TaxID=329726 RepID=B0CFZ9_ACAM1|nr:allophycocyanin subunit ApcA [Acaryochloris marina]ABW29446.1 allophycocyanin alpha subunit ApcA [Acaryochloris marina MBIC11017]BDM78361.1 allophycocyanin subunit alpha [Acaryochloris marina MBIC10699]